MSRRRHHVVAHVAVVAVVALAGGCTLPPAGDTGRATASGHDGHSPDPHAGVDELAIDMLRAAPTQPNALAADAHGAVAVGLDGVTVAYSVAGDDQWAVDPDLGTGTVRAPIALGADLVVVPVFDLADAPVVPDVEPPDPDPGAEDPGAEDPGAEDPGADARDVEDPHPAAERARVDRSSVLALDRATGQTRWRAFADDPRALAVGAAADGSTLVATAARSGTVRVLRADDGAPVTELAFDFGHLFADPGLWIRSGRLVVAWSRVEGSEIRVLDPVTGVLQWSWTGPALGAAPAVDDTQVIQVENLDVESPVVHGVVHAFDLASGAERWSTPVDGLFFSTIGTALTRSRVVILDVDGRFTALDARTGAIQWHRATRRTQLVAAPLLTGKVAAATTYGTGLVALAAATGRPIANQHPGRVQTAVTIEASGAGAGAILLAVQHQTGDGEVWWLRPR